MALNELLGLSVAEKRNRGVEFTPHEIAQQPDMWLRTAVEMREHASLLESMLMVSRDVVLTGAGSSYFIGECAEPALAGRLNEQRVRAVPSTQIVMDPQSLLPRGPFTLVSLARSGNSPEGNAAFRLAEALRPGLVKHIVLTCNPEGELAQLAKTSAHPAALFVLPQETNDQGLAMTSSFTSLVVAAQGLGFLDSFQTYVELVERLAGAGRALLSEFDAAIESLAAEPVERAFFIGGRPFFGAALESHLKVQEMTGGAVLAKAEDTLGLRHGPMAGVNSNTIAVLFASSDPYRRRYEKDLIAELAAKNLGRQRAVVCAQSDNSLAPAAHHVIEYDKGRRFGIPDDLASPLAVLPGQLYGLYKGLALGLSPDRPSESNVINRVVEGVTIYPFEGGDGVKGAGVDG